MTDEAKTGGTTPTPDELREQVDGTRKELGETVEALAAKADVKSRVQDKAVAVKGQVQDSAVHARAQAQEKTGQALRVAEDRIPQPVWVKMVRAAHAIRRNKGRILAGSLGAAAVLAVARRNRRRR